MNTRENRTKEPTYTLEDVGCYVDGARGIHAIDRILCFAEDHGLKWEAEALFANPLDTDDYEYSDEAEDVADRYMNENYGVEGAYWGRNENSDWGLWAIEDTNTGIAGDVPYGF
jgi:hypothetical protein